jgi:tetratricopeptide (TPR) repeat protein
VVELFVGRQAPAGPDAATGLATETRSAGHVARAGEYRELGGYGMVARLACAGGGHEVSGPLFDQHGFLAGWHAVRVVDGQTLAFALPLERLKEGLTEVAPVSVAEWNRQRKPEADEVYAQAMGHVWAGDFEGAAYYWRKASEVEPENARTWFHLAFMEGKTGHSQAKTRCFRKAIALQPDFAEAHYNLGIGLALACDREGALAEVKALRQIDQGLANRLSGFLGIEHTDELPGKKSDGKPAGRTLV